MTHVNTFFYLQRKTNSLIKDKMAARYSEVSLYNMVHTAWFYVQTYMHATGVQQNYYICTTYVQLVHEKHTICMFQGKTVSLDVQYLLKLQLRSKLLRYLRKGSGQVQVFAAPEDILTVHIIPEGTELLRGILYRDIQHLGAWH